MHFVDDLFIFSYANTDSVRDETGNIKVKWDAVCLPKCEGGLGIRRLKLLSTALMTTHVWSILSNRMSLCIKWIHSYRLQHMKFLISRLRRMRIMNGENCHKTEFKP